MQQQHPSAQSVMRVRLLRLEAICRYNCARKLQFSNVVNEPSDQKSHRYRRRQSFSRLDFKEGLLANRLLSPSP